MREPAKSFRDLAVWQKAHELVLSVYRLSATFPQHELYGLTAQLRRAAVSIPANIAEGFRRRGKGDKARMLNIAESSLDEVRYYLLLAHDLAYADDGQRPTKADEISRMLTAYSRAVLESARD